MAAVRLTGTSAVIFRRTVLQISSILPVLNAAPARNMTSQNRPKVLITRRVPSKGVELLKEHCEIDHWNHDEVIPRDELLKRVAGKDALFCLLTDKIDKELLDAAGPSLKTVGTMSVGYDHVDLAECHQRSIPIGYTPDVLTDATAELTMALLLATSRRIVEGVDAVKNGEWGTWSPLWLCGPALLGSTIGIVGLGRIGMAVARCLQPFGVSRFIYSDAQPMDHAKEINGEYVSFDQLLAESDFVLTHVALTPETTGMFNKEAFAKMKKSAIFINTSRGPVADMDDLYEALKNGEIHAAGLDVTVPEPLSTTSPLLTLNNCVVLPHIASATNETRSKMSELTGRNILAALRGEPLPAQIKL